MSLTARYSFGLIKKICICERPKKQGASYLALIRSVFEHCSVIWRPSSHGMIQKIEAIQSRALKWIKGFIYVINGIQVHIHRLVAIPQNIL